MATADQLARLKLLAGADAVVAATADAELEALIDVADERLSTSAWGARRDDALAWWALHLLHAYQGGSGGGGGPVDSESVGQWSRSFAVPQTRTADAWYSTTPYGRALLALRRSRVATLPTVIL